MTFKQIIKAFRKSHVVLDLRTTAQEQRVADIKSKAQRYETLKHTAGKPSVYAGEPVRLSRLRAEFRSDARAYV